MSERYLAAIEVSSSKIIATVGKTRGMGYLDVIAVEQEPTVDGGVRYGIIQNLEEAATSIARVFNRLEQRSAVNPRKIKGVIVGLGGRSLKNITKEVSMNLPEDTEITEDIINKLKEQATNSAIDNTLEVIDAVPRIFKVGTSETSSPKGMVGNHISAIFDLIVCRPELKRNIRKTIADKLELRVDGFVVTAMATGHLILTQEEKMLGCMLVDMGAETTTVTIYQKGSLQYFATIPMGGKNISRDIASLGVVDSKAEEIKLSQANAMAGDDIPALEVNGLKLSDISNYVVARSEEIVANIIEQMEYAGIKESDLQGGIVCIGGGFRLKGIKELLKRQTDLPVRTGTLPDYVKIEDHRAANAELTEVVSVLYAGATLTEGESLEMPEASSLPINGSLFPEIDEEEKVKKPEQEKRPPKKGFFDNLKDRVKNIGTMFSGPEEDDSAELL
ncbi:MAG: cell division protein FtsA [Muribaculaceae bacterium]|nr:cell division protein FtsA [Muribaculaceae bacterium]